MAVSTAMAAIASSQAALAAAAAHRAEVAQCKANMPLFDAKTATVDAMREYAHCVAAVYPEPASGSTIILFKILFVVALVGLVVGVWRAWRDSDDLEMMALSGLVFFCAAPITVAFIGGLVYGVWWLLV